MIKSIDGLLLPPSITGTAEQFNRDSQKRTVSGRLITKLDPVQKWRVTVAFDDFALSLDYQAQFYAKCLAMRLSAKTIVFVSPYDGSEVTITAKCISRSTPQPTNLHKRTPQFYIKAGAVFEEV